MMNDSERHELATRPSTAISNNSWGILETPAGRYLPATELVGTRRWKDGDDQRRYDGKGVFYACLAAGNGGLRSTITRDP